MSTVGLVDRYGDGWSITDLDALVVGLVSGGNSQKGEADKSLHVYSDVGTGQRRQQPKGRSRQKPSCLLCC